MNVAQLVELVGETEVPGENLPHFHFFTTNSPSSETGLNPSHRDGSLATNGLSYGTALFHVFALFF
jgi:hypothetical protein